jgi:hypothetical protein
MGSARFSIPVLTPTLSDSPVQASVSPVQASVSPVQASVSPVQASVSPVQASVSPVQAPESYLHSITIHKEYQNQKWGSFLLKRMEYILKINYGPQILKSTLWDDHNSPFVQDFFLKNGYTLEHENALVYDDQTRIVDVIPMHKKLL